MRICLTVPSLEREFGGPSHKAGHLVGSLRLMDHDVHVVGCGEATGATGLPALGRFHTTPIPRRIQPLYDAIDDADVVHVLGYRDPIGTLAGRRALRKGIPFVLEPVGMYRPLERSFLIKKLYQTVIGERLSKDAAAFVATSRFEAGELVDAGLPAERIFVRPNGIEVDPMLPLPARGSCRSSFGIPEEAPLVLSLGRISRKKRLEHLIAAVASIPDAHVLIVGPDMADGSHEVIMQERARHGLQDRVHVRTSGIWAGDRAALFADADIFCMPSASENFGTAALEAAGVGLPVVISDRCGGAEWISPDAGVVFPFGNLDALSVALERVIHDERFRSHASEQAREIRETLSWDVLAKKQVQIYEEIT